MDLDGGDHDYDYCDRDVTIKVADAALHRTMLPLLRLKFNFSFILETSNWTLTGDSPALALTGGSFSSEHQSSATVTVAGGSLSYNDAGAAIEEAVGDFLAEEERLELVEEAWRAAREHLPAAGTLPMFGVLEVNFNVHVDEREVVVDGGGGDGMVPAADSSLEMLEKCKADCGGSCCICLEEFFGGVGGGGFRMPCLHVFHGGCIREWLRSSHYCPLCRYEMPTAAAEEKEENGDGFDEDDMCIC